jgi:hypothetical protein
MNLVPSTLPCLVYGIPLEWNICCWLTEALSNSLMQSKQKLLNKKQLVCEYMARLNNILFKALEELEGPNMLKQSIFRLISRNTRRI